MSLYDSLKNAPSFFLIAGPCVVESDEIMWQTARFLQDLSKRLQLPFVFKSSYKKANRSSGSSYSGPGIKDGLRILAEIKQELGLSILSDVHEVCEVSEAAEICDILQIPAFLSRQTDLIRAAAATGKIVNIKKAQFMAPEDMRAATAKAEAVGNQHLLVTERGTSFGYHDLVVDFRSFGILNQMGYPVIYDLTHSLQRPSSGVSTGGNPEFAPLMARAALATGKVRGLFIECHPDPPKALSDAATMLSLNEVEDILTDCLKLAQVIGRE